MDTMVNCAEEQNIIRLLNERSEQGLSELSSKYGAACKNIARNILNDDRDIEECLNDTWLAAWNAIPPASPDPLSAFVIRITKNLSLKKARYNSAGKRNSFYELSYEELAECVSFDPGNSSEVDENPALTAAIEHFLEGLAKRNRIIVVKKYWYFKSVEEISREMNMSESNVKVVLHRLRKQLEGFLKKEGYRYE